MTNRAREAGGATLEYVLISTFAAALSIAAMTYVGRLVKSQLAALGERLDQDLNSGDDDGGFDP